MVLKLLEIKEHLKNFYEKYGVYVRILLKLVCTFLLLTIIIERWVTVVCLII